MFKISVGRMLVWQSICMASFGRLWQSFVLHCLSSLHELNRDGASVQDILTHTSNCPFISFEIKVFERTYICFLANIVNYHFDFNSLQSMNVPL